MKTLFVITVAYTVFAAALAQAHPVIRSAEPGVGTVTQAPKEVRVHFDEALVPAFSGLSVYDQRGNVVAKGMGRANVQNEELFLPLTQPLAPGKYVVTWYAVSADTHRVHGKYNFEVRQ
jgi:methionine-rich copper-binding protein CopC